MNHQTIYKKHVTVQLPEGYTTTAKHIIPPRIDKYKSQQDVKPEQLELRPDGELYCSKYIFNKIPTYQWGGPTGGAQGKMWKRIAGSGWDFRDRHKYELCWMGVLEVDRTGETKEEYYYTNSLPLHCIVT